MCMYVRDTYIDTNLREILLKLSLSVQSVDEDDISTLSVSRAAGGHGAGGERGEAAVHHLEALVRECGGGGSPRHNQHGPGSSGSDAHLTRVGVDTEDV